MKFEFSAAKQPERVVTPATTGTPGMQMIFADGAATLNWPAINCRSQL